MGNSGLLVGFLQSRRFVELEITDYRRRTKRIVKDVYVREFMGSKFASYNLFVDFRLRKQGRILVYANHPGPYGDKREPCYQDGGIRLVLDSVEKCGFKLEVI